MWYLTQALKRLSMAKNIYIPFSVNPLMMLDVMFGMGICEEIKQMNKAIPIILMSTNPKLLENYIEYNADDIIEKPFDNDEVLNKINNILVPASKRA
jgi:DNA-binding response OmpR family regulator